MSSVLELNPTRPLSWAFNAEHRKQRSHTAHNIVQCEPKGVVLELNPTQSLGSAFNAEHRRQGSHADHSIVQCKAT